MASGVQYKLSDLNFNLEAVMEEVRNIMELSVKGNFDVGGRPNKWQKLKKTDAPSHLYQSGRLFSSIQSRVGVSGDTHFAEVSVDVEQVPYARIHNFGGIIKHPGSNKFQAFQIGDKWVYTNHTEPHDIPMPERRYMMFQEEDISQIVEAVVGVVNKALAHFTESTKKGS